MARIKQDYETVAQAATRLGQERGRPLDYWTMLALIKKGRVPNVEFWRGYAIPKDIHWEDIDG